MKVRKKERKKESKKKIKMTLSKNKAATDTAKMTVLI
jgi:hypothetical protein